MQDKLSRQKPNNTLLKSMDILLVELQGLRFLLEQGIIMARSETSVITFEVESLTSEIQRLGTTIKRRT